MIRKVHVVHTERQLEIERETEIKRMRRRERQRETSRIAGEYL